MDDVQVMEWQEMITMVTEAESVRDQSHEKNVMAFRMSHIDEEREGENAYAIHSHIFLIHRFYRKISTAVW